MATPETRIYSPVFAADALTQMRRGEVRLHVPLRDSIIQVGTDVITETGEIAVNKRLRSISVRNTDGSPLQVEVIDENSGDATPVFTDPVAEVGFGKTRDLLGDVCWFAFGEGVNINNKAAVARFANVVGMFALTKQGGTLTSMYLSRINTRQSHLGLR